MAFSFTDMNTTIGAIDAYMGRLVTWLSRDNVLTVEDFRAPLNKVGDEGDALIHIPISSVADPLFEDKITDDNATEWRIMEVLQANDVHTPCRLKHVDYWKTLNLEAYNPSNDTWEVNTSGIIGMVTTSTTDEIIAAEDGHSVTEYEVRTRYLVTPTARMRFALGSKYLYIQGVRNDDSRSKFSIFECIEEEA